MASSPVHCTYTHYIFQVTASTNIHTHTFNGPFSRTIRVGRYQKGKTNLDFTEARDSEWQWHQLGLCKSAPRSKQITTPAPHHSVFYRPDALPAAQPTASKHWRHSTNIYSRAITTSCTYGMVFKGITFHVCNNVISTVAIINTRLTWRA